MALRLLAQKGGKIYTYGEKIYIYVEETWLSLNLRLLIWRVGEKPPPRAELIAEGEEAKAIATEFAQLLERYTEAKIMKGTAKEALMRSIKEKTLYVLT